MSKAQLPEPGEPGVIYVLDLSGFVFRAYHALPPMATKGGDTTHAIHGVVSMIQRLLADKKPAYFAVAVDTSRALSFRKAIYADYKATRKETPPDLIPQAIRVREIAIAYGLPVLECESFEADDVIATVVGFAKKNGLRTVIVSADKDLLQLVDETVVMFDTMRDKLYGEEETVAKLGVLPNQVRDYLSLVGDASDNVPGVPSVGPKTAVQLLTDHKTLDGVYAAVDSIAKNGLREKLKAHRDDAYLSQRLVSLRDDVPVGLDALEVLKVKAPDVEKLIAIFGELELHRARKELERAVPEARGATSRPVQPKKPFVKPHTEVALDANAIGAFIARIGAAHIAVDVLLDAEDPQRSPMVGFALATVHEALYVPVGHVYLGRPPLLPVQHAAGAIVAALASHPGQRAFHDAKNVLHAFARADAESLLREGDLDTMLASYLLTADAHDHTLDGVATRMLETALPPLASTDKKRTRWSERTIEEVADTAGSRASAIAQLVQPLRDGLEEQALLGVMRDLELPLVPVLVALERRGVTIDVEKLHAMSATFAGRLLELERACHQAAGHEFNVSSPRALETVLFDELGLPVKKRTKTARSTDAEVLEELEELHALPRAILELRSVQKLKSTYVDALPKQMDPKTHRVHTRFNQAVAATGRLSSSDPNLQNIPIRTEEGRAIRDAFIAPPGHVVLSADYSQIELRVLAHLSNDPQLVEAFVEDKDVHIRTATALFDVPESEVTREQRGRAKTVNFAVIYGQAERALARNLDVEEKEAKRYIAAFFERYAGVSRYLNGLVDEARRTGSVRTMFGRKRDVPDIHSRNWSLRWGAERIAKNTPIQGTAADILKTAMIRIPRALEEAGLQSRMVLTVHDELVFEVPEHEVEVCRPLVRRVMEQAAQLAVPLLVEDGVGPTWGKAH